VTAGDMNEIEANIRRSLDSYKAAETLLHNGYPDYAASRAYYAAFYAVSALLASKDFFFRKHSAIISSFHREFIKTSLLDIKYGQMLNELFELRAIGDYGEVRHVGEQEAQKAIDYAREIHNAVSTYLKNTC